MVNEVAKLLYHCHLCHLCLPATSSSATSSSACFPITELARPFVLHEQITSLLLMFREVGTISAKKWFPWKPTTVKKTIDIYFEKLSKVTVAFNRKFAYID